MLPEDFSPELNPTQIDPVFRFFLETTRREMLRLDAPQDPWLWTTRALALYAGIHGISHLNTFGVTRYLNKAGKKQVFSCVATHIITGVEVALPEGKSYTVPPHRFVGELHENVPPAREWPKNSKADIAAALFRGAVEMAMKSGLEDLKISEAADQAGISHSDALQVLDPATSFAQQVDDYLDGVAKRTIGSQPASLPPGSHPVCLSKALGIGNIGLAMSDPDGFDIHTAITSRSIVPNTFEQSPENHDMGKAFETHLNITRMGIELGGGPRSSW